MKVQACSWLCFCRAFLLSKKVAQEAVCSERGGFMQMAREKSFDSQQQATCTTWYLDKLLAIAPLLRSQNIGTTDAISSHHNVICSQKPERASVLANKWTQAKSGVSMDVSNLLRRWQGLLSFIRSFHLLKDFSGGSPT